MIKKLNFYLKSTIIILRAKNEKLDDYNGIFERYKYPVLTGKHAPVHWRFDLNYEANPNLQERLGVNAAFNAGAMEWEGKILLVSRTEGYDRKSFFAIAESENGIDNFKFLGLSFGYS